MNITCAKFLLVVSIAAFGSGAFAQHADLAARREMAAKVVQANMQAFDAEKMVASTTESIQRNVVGSLKRSNPNLPDAYYAKAADVVTREIAPSLTAVMLELMPPMLASITESYAQNFTVQELAELVKIYETPLLRRSVSITQESVPKLMEPMTQALVQRAQAMGSRITQALTREGLLPPPKP